MASAKTVEETGKRHTRRFAGTLRIENCANHNELQFQFNGWRLSSPESSLLGSSFPILHPSGRIAVKCGNTKYLFSKLYKLSTVFTRPKNSQWHRIEPSLSPHKCYITATCSTQLCSAAVLQWGHRGPRQWGRSGEMSLHSLRAEHCTVAHQKVGRSIKSGQDHPHPTNTAVLLICVWKLGLGRDHPILHTAHFSASSNFLHKTKLFLNLFLSLYTKGWGWFLLKSENCEIKFLFI